MDRLILHEFHEKLGARFTVMNGVEAVADYGDPRKEHRGLSENACLLDLSFRSRLCLVGADRIRFLHGQVTNDIKGLAVGQGCYAALVTAKGRMQSDLNIYCLADELLLDFEPGLARLVKERLEKYIVADDVQVVDVSADYGLLSVQGPKAAAILEQSGMFGALPATAFQNNRIAPQGWGDIYVAKHARSGSDGFDLFVPAQALGAVAEKVLESTSLAGGCPGGWISLEMARIEAGIPRFGADMDESNLPQECGIEQMAIRYDKGCYIGQEVLNRLHTLGHVNRELRGLLLPGELKALPQKGDKLIQDGREVGVITSAIASPRFGKNIALGYLRRESSSKGNRVDVHTREGLSPAVVSDLPFNVGATLEV